LQIVHATFPAGEGKEAVQILNTLGVDIENYKLINSNSGDLLIINLLYGDIDILLDNLKSSFNFDNNKERSLIIFTPDTVIPRNKKKFEEAESHATRESLISFAQNNSMIGMDYILLVIFSAVITSLGLILDNVAVIVGGMVIAPVLGPILAITIGIVLGKTRLIRQGIMAELIAITLAILVGIIFGTIIPEVEINNALKIRMFPTIADLFIAMAAGAAGAYVLIKGQLHSGLIGVMVAASLLPVMSTIGIGISIANRGMIIGAILLLTGNYLALFLANIIVFYFEGLKPQNWFKHRAERIIKKSLIFIILAIILLIIPLIFLTISQFYLDKPAEIVKNIFKENLHPENDYLVERVEIEENMVKVILFTVNKLDENILYKIEGEIERILARDYKFKIKIIPMEEVIL
jgi:uncharacterized hydrophobic protein (TIGR00341 family)